jgi:4'-phosphopantetheinyl transferase
MELSNNFYFSTSNPPLSDDECHLWHIPLSPAYAAKLRPGELARYRRITHPEVREDYTASQAGLREVLGHYVSIPPDEMVLLRGERGKPYLASGPEFNLTHSSGLVLVAVAGQPVGLDVENATRDVRFADLAAKFFSVREQQRIATAPEEQRNSLFLRHWVCKEATVKLSGDGIFRGLRDAEVVLDPDGRASGKYRGRRVFFLEFEPAPGHLAALASWASLRLGGRFRL